MPTLLHARRLDIFLPSVFLRLGICCPSSHKPLLGLPQIAIGIYV